MKHTANPRTAFLRHRATAERRNIPFRLTYDEWWSVWAPHWDRRDAESLAMCRTRDQGAYELGNVRIDTTEANAAELAVELMAATLEHEIAGMRISALPDRIARFEKRAIALALARADGNVTNAAARLGITFRAMRYLLKKYDIKVQK